MSSVSGGKKLSYQLPNNKAFAYAKNIGCLLDWFAVRDHCALRDFGETAIICRGTKEVLTYH